MLTYTNTRVKEEGATAVRTSCKCVIYALRSGIAADRGSPRRGGSENVPDEGLESYFDAPIASASVKIFFCLDDTTSLKPSLVSCYLVRESNVSQVARGGFYEYYA